MISPSTLYYATYNMALLFRRGENAKSRTSGLYDNVFFLTNHCWCYRMRHGFGGPFRSNTRGWVSLHPGIFTLGKETLNRQRYYKNALFI